MAPWPKQQFAQESRGGAWQSISQVQVWALSCECGTPSFQRSVKSTLSCIQRSDPVSSKLSAPNAHFCRSGQRNWRSILDPHFGSLFWNPFRIPILDARFGGSRPSWHSIAHCSGTLVCPTGKQTRLHRSSITSEGRVAQRSARGPNTLQS